MRRTFCLAAVLALVAGGLLLLPAEDRPARASGSGGSGWVHYVYDKPGTPTKSGDKVGFAEVFNMGAQIHLHALRAECSSGTRTGGAAHDRFVVVGLRVANPRPECSYSWTARSDVKSPVFHAKVRLGKRGFVAGRSEGTVKLKVYGDLGWACERSVAARNYLGGRWSAAWPPSYTPPGASSVITYKKGEDKKPLKGEDTASGIQVDQ